MNQEEILRKLEGLHTVETAAEVLGIKRQSVINLLSRLKKQGHVTVSGHKKRLYKITMRKQRKRDPGMFDIINKYSPNMKLMPWYDHQVHGEYTVEDALVEAIQTGEFRVILCSMHLFGHVKDWPKLYRLAKERGFWQKIGALYELARIYFKVRRMPLNYPAYHGKKWVRLTQLRKMNFPKIAKKWHVYIPFKECDLREA